MYLNYNSWIATAKKKQIKNYVYMYKIKVIKIKYKIRVKSNITFQNNEILSQLNVIANSNHQ